MKLKMEINSHLLEVYILESDGISHVCVWEISWEILEIKMGNEMSENRTEKPK